MESTFSMMKAKFGDSIRSKTDVAMVNESLCKILCHNICCLIQSTHELGIEAKFWNEGEIAESKPKINSETEVETDTDDLLLGAMAWI